MADNTIEDIESIKMDDSPILGTQLSISDIKEKIGLLGSTGKEDLKGAMTELKLALRANPEASNLLLPEEIGEMVSALYRLTDQKVLEIASKKVVGKSKKVDLAKVNLNELGDF